MPRRVTRYRGYMRVLQSFTPPGPRTNPYLSQLLDALRRDHHVACFSWRTALCDNYDVLHIQWPEELLQGDTWWKTVGHHLAYTALLGKMALTGTPIVRTMHNASPHEPPSLPTALLLQATNALTKGHVHLNPVSTRSVNSRDVGAVILHGHYRDWLSGYPQECAVPGRILFAGLVRAYKNVPALIDAFCDLPTDDLTLRIVGAPQPGDLADEILAKIRDHERISATLDYVDDAHMVKEITASQLVVLPYREMHNSGVALLALSLERPVLMPSSPASEALRDEVGTAWVHTYAGPLTTEALARAANHFTPTGKPDLSRRSWSHAGAAHTALYKQLVK